MIKLTKHVALTSCLVAMAQAYAFPIDGPLLPRPTALSESTIVRSATEQLNSLLDSAISGDIVAGWPVQNTSFSIALVSLDKPKQDVSWEYHHRAVENVDGAKVVDGDSQYPYCFNIEGLYRYTYSQSRSEP